MLWTKTKSRVSLRESNAFSTPGLADIERQKADATTRGTFPRSVR